MPFNAFPILQNQCLTLLPGKPQTFTFSADEFLSSLPEENQFRLRICGDCSIHDSWMWEGGFPLLYRDIDDALCTETHHSAYSLRLEETAERYSRSVYFKLPCPPRCTAQFEAKPSEENRWQFHLWLKGESFSAQAEHSFVRIERFLSKPGRNARDINGAADETILLPLPQGTFDWQELSAEVLVGPETACLLFSITVIGTTGTLLLEDPVFENSEGQSVLPTFAPANRYAENLNWLGENLSRKEWTDLAVTLNGKRLPDTSLFQRCHLRSENEIVLPAGEFLPGRNTIILENCNHYLGALPYRLQTLQILYASDRLVELQAVPRVVRLHQDFPVLISTRQPQTTVTLHAGSPEIVPCVPQITFAEPGLHVVTFDAHENGADLSLSISAGSVVQSAVIERVIDKKEDDVLTGTGDSIYIPQETTAMADFLVWYLSNHLGNYITFRPTYRWCGTRELNPLLWEKTTVLCNEMQLYYCHMIDGRELPGINANPTREQLEGPYFTGNQGHERDGAFCYWQVPDFRTECNELLFRELHNRILKHPDWSYSNPLIYTEKNVYPYINCDDCEDTENAHNQFVVCAKEALRGVERHTGPSALFRDFFAAGLPIGGAETMYGPNEVLLSILRGASKAYHRPYFISHLALQWYSTPHDTAANCRRYQLALFTCYLQGVGQINTEEGLWHMEEDFSHYDRFSHCCRSHAEIQQQFTKFVETHTRRGTPVVPAAVLHGRFDGWRCFGRTSPWGKTRPEWQFGAPEKSCDLLRVFFPDSVLDALYRHPCPDSPQGFYTKTPYGCTDIVPVEADGELLAQYDALAFFGYHAARPGDLERLEKYVRQGGTLLLAWPHLSSQTNLSDIVTGKLQLLDGQELLTGVTLNGFLPECEGLSLGNVTLGEQSSVLCKRNDQPLMIRNTLGKGTVFLLNTREYPSAEQVVAPYESMLRLIATNACEKQHAAGWMETDDTVQFAAYDENGSRTIYAINTNWWQEDCPPASAKLLIGSEAFPVLLESGVIHTFSLYSSFAFWTNDNETEILVFSPDCGTLKIQGYGESSWFLLGNFNQVIADGFSSRRINDCTWELFGKLSGVQRISLHLI